MNLLIVPKPLFTSSMQVRGYYLAVQWGNALLESAKPNPLDRAMQSPFVDFMNEVGLTALTQNNLLFIPFTQIQLFTAIDLIVAESIEKDKVVFLLDTNIEYSDIVLERCEYFKKAGFKMAAYFRGKVNELLPVREFLDFIFIKMQNADMIEQSKILKAEFTKPVIVALDVESKPIFDKMVLHSACKVDLFDGAFYKVHATANSKQNSLSPLKTNYIQLLNIVNQEDFDFHTFTRTIRQDTALAIQFMRLVNNSSNVRSEIKNLNQAAAMLGQREIKKWVSAAVNSALCVDSPTEIMRLSLIRAKFCENMAGPYEMGLMQENLFLTGLFSVLDVVLDLPIEDAFKMVYVPPVVHAALVDKKGDFHDVLEFVKQYEMGHWNEISRIALMRNISIEQIHTAYKDALIWYSEMINFSVDHDVF